MSDPNNPVLYDLGRRNGYRLLNFAFSVFMAFHLQWNVCSIIKQPSLTFLAMRNQILYWHEDHNNRKKIFVKSYFTFE